MHPDAERKTQATKTRSKASQIQKTIPPAAAAAATAGAVILPAAVILKKVVATPHLF